MDEIKCPCGLRNYMEEVDCKQTNCNACCPLTQPQTNADRIRAMSDEELAEFISSCGCPDHARNCADSCKDCTMDWLKQPVEVDNG